MLQGRLSLGGTLLPWCPLSGDRLAWRGGRVTRMAAGSTKPQCWGDGSCADPKTSLGVCSPGGAPAGNGLPKRGEPCGPLGSYLRGTEGEQRSRTGALLVVWWQRYQGMRSHQVKCGREGGEMGILAHNLQPLLRTTRCRCRGGWRWRKAGKLIWSSWRNVFKPSGTPARAVGAAASCLSLLSPPRWWLGHPHMP